MLPFARNRECLFGEVVDEKMCLSQGGKIADECSQNIPSHYPHIVLDEYVIMPNHVHGIIFIGDDVGVQNFEPLQIDDPRENKFPKIIPKLIGSITVGSIMRRVL